MSEGEPVSAIARPVGWACPSNSKKFHYFIDARSLCMKWLFFGQNLEADNGKPSPSECKECRKRLTKMNEKLKAGLAL